MSFDLERARDAVLMYNVNKTVWAHSCAEHLPGAIDLIESQTAEIERLRSEKTFLEKVVHIKNTRLKELEADLEQSERVIEARLDVIDQQAVRIRELEDALVEERARMDHSMIRGSSCKFYDECNHGNFCGFVGCPHKTDFLGFARSQLVAEGKIGPDAKPRVWKITEERKEAIRDAEIALRDAVLDSNDPHCWDAETAVLRAMLEEAMLEEAMLEAGI